MASKATQALEDELGGPPPGGIAEALSPRELARLADALRAARESQSAALDEAMEQALDHVPRLARGPVRRILFG